MAEDSKQQQASGGGQSKQQAAAGGNLTDEVRRALEAKAAGTSPELLALQEAQIEEYGTWVAVQPIDFGGVRAYDTGHAVPISNVEAYKYDELGWVDKRDSKAGKDAIATLTGTEA